MQPVLLVVLPLEMSTFPPFWLPSWHLDTPERLASFPLSFQVVPPHTGPSSLCFFFLVLDLTGNAQIDNCIGSFCLWE